MARTGQAVQSLVEDEAGMADAIETVLDRAEDGTVSWADVNDELTSGQWGRLIETGVLVEASGHEGDFEIPDPEAARDALDTSEAATEADEESSWSTYDKLAALGAVAMFAGYSWGPLRNVVGSVMDNVLGPFEHALPFYAVVLVLALFTGLYSTLLQANLMDMDKMSEYQQRMKEIQRREKEAKEQGNDDELEQIREEQMSAMGDNLGMFKEQFRPMVWIMLLTIPVFLWMYWRILQGGGPQPTPGGMVMPFVGEVTWQKPVLGPLQAWILWYFLCSMGFTQIIRKALNIQTTPST
ncbi:MAG: DUF106 domain-containing protein [Haloarculaceae archaeon]